MRQLKQIITSARLFGNTTSAEKISKFADGPTTHTMRSLQSYAAKLIYKLLS